MPLVLALFPAALLSPLSERLKRRVAPAAAAGIVVAGFVLVLAAALSLAGWLVADEIPAVVDALEEAYADVESFLTERFDVTIPAVEDALDSAEEWARGNELGRRAGRSRSRRSRSSAACSSPSSHSSST